MTTVSLIHVSEKPWSEYTKTDYTPEQWHKACLIHLHDGSPTAKDQCKLPVRTPGGAVSRPGVHAAAAALAGARGGVDAPAEAKNKAVSALIRLYGELGEDPPPSLKHADVEDFLQHVGVKGMKWGRRKTSGSSSGGSSKITRKQNRQMNREARSEFDRKKIDSIFRETLQKGDKVLVSTQLMGTYGKTVMTGKEFSDHMLRGGAMDVRTTEIFARQNKSGQYEANTNAIGNYQKQNFRNS